MDPVTKPLVGCMSSPFTYAACNRSVTVYYSAPISANCPAGTSGEPVTVEGGRFTSTTSQADADAQAQTLLDNLLTEWCTPTSNTVTTPVRYESAVQTANCPSTDIGGPFTIPAGQYESLVSQADADAQAQAHLQTLISMFCQPDPTQRTFAIKQLTDGAADYAYYGVNDLAVLTQERDFDFPLVFPVAGQTTSRVITIFEILHPLNIAILDGKFVLGLNGTQSASMTVKKNGTTVNTQSNSALGTTQAIQEFSLTAQPGDIVTIEFDFQYTGTPTGVATIESRLQVTETS